MIVPSPCKLPDLLGLLQDDTRAKPDRVSLHTQRNVWCIGARTGVVSKCDARSTAQADLVDRKETKRQRRAKWKLEILEH